MRLAFLLALLLTLPASAADWAASCDAGMRRGDLSACEAAARESPKDPARLRLLANAYFHDGRYEESIAVFRAAIRQAPEVAELHFEFSGLLSLLGDMAGAIPEAEAAVGIDPAHRRAWALLAICYNSAGRPDLALQASERAAELGDAREAFAMAQHYALGRGVPRDPYQAAEWLERAASGGHVEAMHELADLYEKGRPGFAANAAKARQWRNRAAQAGRP